jgi:hypothetical protein
MVMQACVPAVFVHNSECPNASGWLKVPKIDPETVCLEKSFKPLVVGINTTGVHGFCIPICNFDSHLSPLKLKTRLPKVSRRV